MPATAAPRQQRQGGPPALPPIPFTAAAHEHVEPVTTDNAGAIAAAQGIRGPFDVPAYGFLRAIVFEVNLSGGTLGAGALSADFPFNILQGITLADVNGANLFGPLDGFAALMANVYGGYAYRQDPRLSPQHDGTINGRFYLRVPVEITRHNGYGAVANQNSSAAYKLSYNIATIAQAFATAPTTPPAVQVKTWAECWSQPNVTDLAGRPQQREPIGHGTTQFWTSFTRSGLAAGQLNLLLPRVGNMIRNLIFICRDATGARVDTTFPDPISVMWDARVLTQESQRYRILKQMEGIQAPGARDTGVFAFCFNNLIIGHNGDEEPNLWLPTVQSTRLEVQGTTAVTGSIQALTNDVAPVEVRPDQRYVEDSRTGFHPALGQPVPVAA